MSQLARLATGAALSLLVATPALARDGHRGHHGPPNPAQELERAEYHINQLEDMIHRSVGNPHVRRALLQELHEIEHANRRAYEVIIHPRHGWERGSSHRGGRDDRRGRGHRGYGALTYDDARRIVAAETFDSGRLAAIRSVAGQGRFTVEEVRSLVDMLDFDSSKQKALVALYPATVDKQRYLLALDTLTFSSSRRAVARELGLA